jgi:hypothetical protein
MMMVQAASSQDTQAGNYFYRTESPGKAMAQEEGVFVVNLTNVHRQKDPIMGKADVLILENICDPDLLPLVKERKSNGQLTIYEISDDFGELQPWNPVYFFYQNKENLALVQRLASFCDALQVTSPELKRRYGHLNSHCKIFPNQISYVPPERAFEKKDEVVVGWGGSHGHLEDMAEIARPVIQWITSQTNVVLHLMCSGPTWQLFDSLPSNRKRRTIPGSIQDYYDFLARLDIGIGMLKDTSFNRCRSDIKFLEYAVSGVVPVMARLEPYIDSVDTGKTGLLFSNSRELIEMLDHLVKDTARLMEISKAARQYVLQERLQSQHGQDRADSYRSLIKELHENAHTMAQAFDPLEEWSSLSGSIREHRYLQLSPTRFENLLHNGLVIMQTTEGKRRAQEIFEEASELEPENYLPFLFGSAVSAQPSGWLQKALQLKPDSLRARILLGEALASEGRIAEAFESFDSAARIFPDYEIPYLRAAVLMRNLGENAQAESLFQKAKDLDVRHLLP